MSNAPESYPTTPPSGLVIDEKKMRSGGTGGKARGCQSGVEAKRVAAFHISEKDPLQGVRGQALSCLPTGRLRAKPAIHLSQRRSSEAKHVAAFRLGGEASLAASRRGG